MRNLLKFLRKLSSDARKPRVQGFFDALTHGEWLVGWAWIPRTPSRRLEIAVLEGDTFLGGGIADLPRRDLLASGIGDGHYGFRIRLTPQAFDGRTRNVRVCALTDRGRVVLQRGNFTLSGVRDDPARAPRRQTIGMLERVSGNTLHGWAFNPDKTDSVPTIDIYDDERFLGSVVANHSRPRLLEKGLPPGVRGFTFELPGAGAALGQLRARISGTANELKLAGNFFEASNPVEDAVDVLSLPPEPILPQADMTVLPPVIGLILVGGGTGADATIASWLGQDYPHCALAIVTREQAQPPLPSHACRISPGDDLALQGFLTGVEYACFVRAGDRLDGGFAALLPRLWGQPDVIVWDGDQPHPALNTDLLKPPIRGFAVRAAHLLRYPGRLSEDLEHGLLHAVRVWLAHEMGLHWLSLDMAGAEGAVSRTPPDVSVRKSAYQRVLDAKAFQIRIPPPDGAPLVLPQAQPQSLSVAIWRGWERPGLEGLAALLEENFSGPIEILVPTGGDEVLGQRRLAQAQKAADRRSNVTCRLVDAAGSDTTVCALLGQAASHAGLVLADAGFVPRQGTLAEILGWAMHPRVGMVGVPALCSDGRRLHGGMQLQAGALVPPDRGTAVIASTISPHFLAIATRKLVAIGGLDVSGLQAFAVLGAALELKRLDHASLLLGHLPARAADDMEAEFSGLLPWNCLAVLKSRGHGEAAVRKISNAAVPA